MSAFPSRALDLPPCEGQQWVAKTVQAEHSWFKIQTYSFQIAYATLFKMAKAELLGLANY